MRNLDDATPAAVLTFFTDMLRGYPCVVKATVVESMSVSVILLGRPTYFNANDIGELLITKFNASVENIHVVRYAQAIIGGRKFTTGERQGQRCNSLVSHGSKVYLIQHILAVNVVHAPCQVCFILKQYKTLRSGLPCDNQTGANASHIVQIADFARDKISLQLVQRSFTKCVTANIDGKVFCMKLPNNVELD